MHSHEKRENISWSSRKKTPSWYTKMDHQPFILLQNCAIRGYAHTVLVKLCGIVPTCQH